MIKTEVAKRASVLNRVTRNRNVDLTLIYRRDFNSVNKFRKRKKGLLVPGWNNVWKFFNGAYRRFLASFVDAKSAFFRFINHPVSNADDEAPCSSTPAVFLSPRDGRLFPALKYITYPHESP